MKESLKINTRSLSKISLIINKMGISKLIFDINVETGNETKDREEVVKQLIALIIDNLYKAEEEIIDLISSLKGITKEEAENYNVIDFVKELLKVEAIKDFLK